MPFRIVPKKPGWQSGVALCFRLFTCITLWNPKDCACFARFCRQPPILMEASFQRTGACLHPAFERLWNLKSVYFIPCFCLKSVLIDKILQKWLVNRQNFAILQKNIAKAIPTRKKSIVNASISIAKNLLNSFMIVPFQII